MVYQDVFNDYLYEGSRYCIRERRRRIRCLSNRTRRIRRRNISHCC